MPEILLCDNQTGGATAQATVARVAWDDEFWRVRFEAADADPWATIVERDGPLWTEEVVEVFFDPVGDLMSYFEVEINPLGTVVDLVLRRNLNGWRKDFGWQIEGLRAHAEKTSEGWSGEFEIPFSALGGERPQTGREWRVNFLRIDRPEGAESEADLSAWSPTGVRNFHRAERFGVMTFA